MLDEQKSVNIDDLKNIIEHLLVVHSIDFISDDDSRGKIFSVKTEEARLDITIGSAWIGYELTIDKSVLGKEIGTFLDTDNYPIAGRNSDISLAIFDELVTCLKGLISKNVYVGVIEGHPVLAVPLNNKNYKIIQKNRFTMSKRDITSGELNDMPNIRPLR